MSDADTEDVVFITEVRTRNSKSIEQPGRVSDTVALPAHHDVWVGNDKDGWRRIPRVTSVVMDLQQGNIRKAVITVLFPRVEFEGGPPRQPTKQE